jgi:hypothetical protein
MCAWYTSRMAPPVPSLAVSLGPLYDDQDHGGLTPAEIEALVDADVAKFDGYFQGELKNEPLTAAERAILKTYLYFKIMV